MKFHRPVMSPGVFKKVRRISAISLRLSCCSEEAAQAIDAGGQLSISVQLHAGISYIKICQQSSNKAAKLTVFMRCLFYK